MGKASKKNGKMHAWSDSRKMTSFCCLGTKVNELTPGDSCIIKVP
jgi:hypothetical protein